MKGKVIQTLDKVYHDMALAELRRAYSKNKKSDISYHDILYLNIIEGHPDKYTASQIADLLNITRPSVTQKINELHKKGYVTRTQSKTDKRVYFLSIKEGSPYFNDVTREDENVLEAEILEKYGEQKIDIFCEILEYISGAYTEKLEEGEGYE